MSFPQKVMDPKKSAIPFVRPFRNRRASSCGGIPMTEIEKRASPFLFTPFSSIIKQFPAISSFHRQR